MPQGPKNISRGLKGKALGSQEIYLVVSRKKPHGPKKHVSLVSKIFVGFQRKSKKYSSVSFVPVVQRNEPRGPKRHVTWCQKLFLAVPRNMPRRHKLDRRPVFEKRCSNFSRFYWESIVSHRFTMEPLKNSLQQCSRQQVRSRVLWGWLWCWTLQDHACRQLAGQ